MISLPRQVVSIIRLVLRASASGTGDYPDGLCHWHSEEVVDELLTRGEKVGVLKVACTAPSPPNTCCKLCRDPCQRGGTGQNQRTRCPGRTALSDVMTALAEAFNNGERETLPLSLVGAMVFHPKNLARTVYWGICRAQRG